MDFEGVNIPMGLSGHRFELIYVVGMGYEGRKNSRFIFVYKGILVIIQGCTRVSEQGISIDLID